MTRTHHRLTMLALSVALPTLGLRAQDQATTAQAQEGVDTRSRAQRVLEGLAKLGSYECTLTTVARNPLQALQGGKRRSKHKLHVVREADGLICWSKQDGKQVLARRGGFWTIRDRNANWIPCRKPEGSVWKQAFLADPTFLSQRLLHVLPKAEWTMTSGALDEKPVRVYSTKIGRNEADHLVRCGALPDADSGALGIGRVIMIQAGGGAALPEPKRQFEISIFEDPKTKLPLKIEVRSFATGGPLARVQIGAPGGIFGQTDEDEDEDEDADDKPKKKKPAMTLTFEFSAVGKAKAADLDKAGRALLHDK